MTDIRERVAQTDLERRVARAIAEAGGFDYERGETSMVMDNYARAALKAIAEGGYAIFDKSCLGNPPAAQAERAALERAARMIETQDQWVGLVELANKVRALAEQPEEVG